MNTYYLIISASLIVIISYLFNLVSKKTNIPSVLLLITLGLLIKGGLAIYGLSDINWYPTLEALGIIGLIMIVLESALDLELSKGKTKLILKALTVALFSIAINIFVIAEIYKLFFVIDFLTAAIYATPVSIISSAIVIPSINFLPEYKKEFLIYESTFSDILGIIAFYSLLMFPHHDSISSFSISVVINFIVTIILAFIISYFILFISQKITTHIKLFLLISILVLFYATGKIFHMSSLIIILVFGLIMNNRHIFIPRPLFRYFDEESLVSITKDIKLITFETSFIVRTFFFVIFGITITLSVIFDFKVLVISFLLLTVIYGARYLLLRVFNGKSSLMPELYIAPRGLITILLFYAIPEEHAISDFSQGILFFIIIVTSLIMTFAMVKYKKDINNAEEEKNELSPQNETPLTTTDDNVAE